MNPYIVSDFNEFVSEFQTKNEKELRYSSFDYCFNYFQNSTFQELEINIEKSCLELAFFLASWGMLRSRSKLFQKSLKYYEPLIKYIIQLKKENNKIWNIDLNNYSNENIEIILEVYKKIRNLITKDNSTTHIVLVSKIMLGVFGCIPAHDRYVTETFRIVFKDRCKFRSINKKSLLCLKDFYESNKIEIDSLQNTITTIEFKTGNYTKIKYSKAKIIDMYAFSKAMSIKP